MKKCMMMWKKIKILKISSYVWELITDLCLHKTFCANLTALVWLNQSLIWLKLIFKTKLFPPNSTSLKLFRERKSYVIYGVSLSLLMVIYLLARERKQRGTFAIATRRSACAILFALLHDKGALHENFSHFLSVTL